MNFHRPLQGNDGTQAGERRQGVFVSLPPPTSLGGPAFAHVLHTFERERVVTCSLNVICGRVQLRRGGRQLLS